MTATTEQRVQLLQHLIDHRPISTAGPQVGLYPSEAHDVATDYGYPNRRRLTTALAELVLLDADPVPDQAFSGALRQLLLAAEDDRQDAERRKRAAEEELRDAEDDLEGARLLEAEARARLSQLGAGAEVVEAYRKAHADA